MFDLSVTHIIKGAKINRSYNALAMILGMDESFGQHEIFFGRLPPEDHTYRIEIFLPPALARPLPIERTLFKHPAIDPPSERLLALRRANAYILHLSWADDYIDTILSDMEDGIIREDGST
ncbi:hypothetical protein B0T14DRAFT_559350 [Immersiella caudata]|uniref:HNH nuclease domain-containing protein n=1 Tax=Immersiella caudata TaxID=314043 RepID=A0AA39XCS6_9PEZI|nr:hypothetical protein B0T14DRAFT_559350 [Immersiella caudata]